MSAFREYRSGGVEELRWWDADVVYLYEERLGILTDGRMPITPLIDKIARLQARAANVARISAKHSRQMEAGLVLAG